MQCQADIAEKPLVRGRPLKTGNCPLAVFSNSGSMADPRHANVIELRSISLQAPKSQYPSKEAE
jgi:hypothetical protein